MIMSNLNTSVKVMSLALRDLSSGQYYQREIKKDKVKAIVSGFDAHKLGVIKVSFREGKYWVYDGQHRVMALNILNGEDFVVPCEVHFGLEYEDEAKLFAGQYDGSTQVDIVYKKRALYEAKDENIVKLKNIVSSVGLNLPFSKSKADNNIIAVAKLDKIFKDLKEEKTGKLLGLIKKTWEGQSTSLDKEILGGIHLFYKTYQYEFDENIFVKSLSKVEPIVIKRRGDSDMSAKGDLKYAKIILDCYNKKLRDRRLEYKFKG